MKKNRCSVCMQTSAHMPADQLRSMNASPEQTVERLFSTGRVTQRGYWQMEICLDSGCAQ